MREWVARFARGMGLAVLGLVVLGFGSWGALLLAFAGPSDAILRSALVFGFCLASVATLIAFFLPRWRWSMIGVFAALFVAIVFLWATLEPTNERDWQPQVAVLPYATISRDQVTVHNIRNFDYRSKADYTIAYYDKSFDLRQLRSVDIVMSYWMGPAIAHVFVSFGFADDDYLAVSVEVRYAKGQDYSTLKGLFRQYELVYGGRRARCHSAAHQLSPESARGCLCLPGQRLGRGRTKVLPGVHESIECIEDAALTCLAEFRTLYSWEAARG